MNLLNTIFKICWLSLLVIVFSGCAVIQQRLEPMICDCETATSCEGPGLEIASAVAAHQVDQAHYRAQLGGEEAARDLGYEYESDEQLASDHDDSPSESKSESETAASERAERLARAEEQARIEREKMALDPVDPYLPQAHVLLETDEDRSAFEANFGITPPDENATVFHGAFRADEDATVAIHRPGQALRIYQEGQLLASRDLSEYDSQPDLEEIGEEQARVVDVVEGTVEVKLIHARPDDEGTTYFVGIYKLIGDEIGSIFHHPIARRDENGALTRFADIQFLHGTDHRTIQWIPLDEEGQPDGDPLIYEWNRWEGVYRIPEPPPTAPNRSTPQS